MKDEFSNENMLQILIDQKKYLEAFRIYKEMMKSGLISDPSQYSNLLREIGRIDPVLTMDRNTKEKKVARLSAILGRIRKIGKKRDFQPQTISRHKSEVQSEKVCITPVEPLAAESVKPESTPIREKGGDILQTIENLTVQSITSIMDIICGNISKEIFSKKAIPDKILILNEMLKRIETIKNQRKKEFANV